MKEKKFLMNSGKIYTGEVIASDEETITIKDKFNHKVSLNKKFVETIEEEDDK